MNIKVERIGGTKKEVSGAFDETEIYIGFVDDMLNLTEPLSFKDFLPNSSLADSVFIKVNHTFKEGSSFIKIKAIAESISLETTQIGVSTKSPIQQNKVELKILGSSSQVLGFKRYITGRDLILIITEAGTKFKRQLGSRKQPCYLQETSSKIESAVEGENALTLKFLDKQLYDAPFYLGDLSGLHEYFKSDNDIIKSDRTDITSDLN